MKLLYRGVYCVVILIDDDHLHVICIDISHVQPVVVVVVAVQVLLGLKLQYTVITFVGYNILDRVQGQNVSLHVVVVQGSVFTSSAHVLLLLIVFGNVMLLQVPFVRASEATISAGVWVGVRLVEVIVMLGILVHTLGSEQAFFTRIALRLLVVNLYVLFHNAILVTLEDTPSADASKVGFLNPRRQILQRLHTVLEVTVTAL